VSGNPELFIERLYRRHVVEIFDSILRGPQLQVGLMNRPDGCSAIELVERLAVEVGVEHGGKVVHPKTPALARQGVGNARGRA
jgi:hypothetical protein